MDRRYSTKYISFFYATEVVGIYLESYTIELFPVYNKSRGEAAQGFCEYDRCAAMKQAIGLAGSLIHRHASFDIIIADLGYFYADVFGHIVFSKGLDMIFCQE